MRILLIEDEPDISKFVKRGLQAESMVVDIAENGKDGIRLALLHPYDAIILDFHLPGGLDGLEVLQKIRESKKSVPVLVLTVEIEVEKKVEMLSLADDYVTKPFSLKEILARLRALVRRGPVAHGNILEVGGLVMDLGHYKVTRAGQPILLRNKEFMLLEYFMRNPGTILSRSRILEHVWDMNADPFTNTVDVHIRLLRRKLNKGFKENIITTIPKRGYKLNV